MLGLMFVTIMVKKIYDNNSNISNGNDGNNAARLLTFAAGVDVIFIVIMIMIAMVTPT